MKINELIEKLNDMSKNGYGDCDICIVLHNTAHQIDMCTMNTDKSNVALMYRATRPAYYLDRNLVWTYVPPDK